jgi:hypothetical protein
VENKKKNTRTIGREEGVSGDNLMFLEGNPKSAID